MRRVNCEYQRSYMDYIDGEWKVVSIAVQKCSYDDYSALIHEPGPVVFLGKEIASDELDDFDAERLVEYFDSGNKAYFEIIHEGPKMFVGDEFRFKLCGDDDGMAWFFELDG